VQPPEPADPPRVPFSGKLMAGNSMKILVWLGIALVVCWGVLWLGIKIAVGAIHLLLLLGAALIVWGFIQGRKSAPH
jgi:hypothetical protein